MLKPNISPYTTSKPKFTQTLATSNSSSMMFNLQRNKSKLDKSLDKTFQKTQLHRLDETKSPTQAPREVSNIIDPSFSKSLVATPTSCTPFCSSFENNPPNYNILHPKLDPTL
jgi:hypothetical protein